MIAPPTVPPPPLRLVNGVFGPVSSGVPLPNAFRIPLLSLTALILLSGAATAQLDTNANGMSDVWERHFNQDELFAPANPDHHPDADPDGDGWTNRQESIAGTDPFNGQPPEGLVVCHITHLKNQEEAPTPEFPEGRLIDLAILSWDTLPGKQYTLIFSASLEAGSWTTVDTPHTGDGHPIAVPVLLTDVEGHSPDRLFWRVQINDQDSDGDGLTDHEEILLGLNPYQAQTFPGIPDLWVAMHFPILNEFDPNDDPAKDGISNAQKAQLDLDPYIHYLIGPVNLGFDEDIVCENGLPAGPHESFRPENPADLFDQNHVPGWQASIGSGQAASWYIEIWDETIDEEGNPVETYSYGSRYAELQAHFGSHGITQQFDMLPGDGLTFILCYKGRYEDLYSNAFTLEVDGAAQVLVNGNPAAVEGLKRRHSFMEDDAFGKYGEWHYALVTITAPAPSSGLAPITLSLVPTTTTSSYGSESDGITYGGFVDMLSLSVSLEYVDPLPGVDPGVLPDTYRPGYCGQAPVLDQGDSFESLEFAGPQAMKFRLYGTVLKRADAVRVTFAETSRYPGWSGNAGDSEEADFSFAAQDDEDDLTVPVEFSSAEAPFFCKDYAAWARVQIVPLKNGEPVYPEPFEITLPHDANGDRIADSWQRREIYAWNTVLRFQPSDPGWIDIDDPATWAAAFGENGQADAEPAMSNGPNGTSPAMADDGDGLTAFQEYRGFFLDGGPAIESPRHKRLSVVGKDLLVECSVMDGINSVDGVPYDPEDMFPDFGNQANLLAQGFNFTNVMDKVSWFYGRAQVGGVIDLYWVRDRLDDEGPIVVYNDFTWRPSAYRHTGVYLDSTTMEWEGGWLSITFDSKLRDEDEETHDNMFRGVGVMGHNENRNPRCGEFLRVALRGRRGKVINSGECMRLASGFAEAFDENKGVLNIQQGAHIFVNSISEEANYTSGQFFGKLSWAVGHELGHLIIIGANDPPMNVHDHISIPGYLMSVSSSLDNCQFHEKEINYTNLRNRASTDVE